MYVGRWWRWWCDGLSCSFRASRDRPQWCLGSMGGGYQVMQNPVSWLPYGQQTAGHEVWRQWCSFVYVEFETAVTFHRLRLELDMQRHMYSCLVDALLAPKVGCPTSIRRVVCAILCMPLHSKCQSGLSACVYMYAEGGSYGKAAKDCMHKLHMSSTEHR